MKIGEHGLGDHLRLLAPLFAFIAAVWALRLVLYAAEAPTPLLRVCSVTVAGGGFVGTGASAARATAAISEARSKA